MFHPSRRSAQALRSATLTTILLAALSSPAFATTSVDDGTIVVTATRQPTPANQLLGDISVLDRADIEQAGPGATLGEMLARLPGIEFSRQGGRGAPEAVFLRGTNAGHVLVLVDGMRIGSATLGATDLANIPSDQIERVEVIRGSASALYGSDEIGGVINIITREEGGPALSGEAGLGSRGAYAASAATAGTQGDLHYQLRAGLSGGDGQAAVTNASSPAYNPGNHGYWSRNLSAGVNYRISPRIEIGAQYFANENQSKFNSSWPSPTLDWRTRNRVSSISAYARLQPVKGWDSTLRLGSSVDDNRSFPSANPGQASDNFRTERTQITWQNDVDLPLGRALVLLERLEEKVVASSVFTLTRRDVNSLSLGWNGNAGAHYWQVNTRRDSNSQYGVKNTYTLGYGYQIAPAWRVAANAGTAFKAPSFNDLYYPLTPFAGVGNPALQPESSRNREISLHYAEGAHKASLTAFRNDIRNLISWEETPPGSWFYMPKNIGSARIDGWSLNYQWAIASGWRLQAAWNEQDPRDKASGKRLARRAAQFGTLGLDHDAGPWRVGAELQFSGNRYDDSANTRRLDSYTLVNVYGSYALTSAWSAFARIDNLLDEHYVLARSSDTTFASLGQSIFVGLRYQMK
ncbi:MAG TPA: TonB-dependent receptor [Rhodocyclaceae bacterium]|nr:TonB-dependent receptor [Rhodocyclaceae bacterium]